MNDGSTEPPPRATQAGERLESWKSIAAYLKRDVTTAQRWERREGMPVHRHVHDRLGTVYAFRQELDAWMATRRAPSPAPALDPTSGPGRPGPDSPGTIRSSLRWLIPVAAATLILIVAVRVLDRRLPRDPLDGAHFDFLTDLGGSERAAVISPDGRAVAFRSGRDGQTDVWVTSPDRREPINLTRGRMARITNDAIRSLGFSPDGTRVLFWAQEPGERREDIGIWSVALSGGDPVPYLPGAAELDWSPAAAATVYHTPEDGDPMYVSHDGRPPTGPVYAAAAGRHVHFPTWSPDGEWIYVVQGELPAALDIWRLRPSGGGAPERLTFHNSRVSHPAFLDGRTLLYLATADDGAGPFVWALDLVRRRVTRLGNPLDQFTSLSAAADGRRLVLTAVRPQTSLWRVPVSTDAPATSATAIEVTSVRTESPRLAGSGLLYVVVSRSGDAIWRLANGRSTRLLDLPGLRLVGRPVVRPDGGAVAIVVEDSAGTRLNVVDGEGGNLKTLARDLRIHGDVAWAPDGAALTVAAERQDTSAIFTVPLDGSPPYVLAGGAASDPVWSPDGRLLLYTGDDVGTRFAVHAVTADGSPYPIAPLALSRGARRLRFLDPRTIVVLKGDLEHKDLWLHDLESGRGRQLTALPRGQRIHDFDLRPGDDEIVLDLVRETADVVLVERSSEAPTTGR